jgi:hypothetical protein
MLQRRKAYNDKITWSDKDERLLLNYLKKNEFNSQKLSALFPKRTLPAIRSKVRKLRIKHDLFGSSYRDTKGDFTNSIAESVKPTSVFDAYAGAGHQSFIWIKYADIVFAAEAVKSKLNQFSKQAQIQGFKKGKISSKWHLFHKGRKKVLLFIGDSLDAAADLKANGIKVDLVDLDTCGSTLPTLPYFLILLKPKNIAITHGEFHSMRFKREDVLRRLLMHRNININPLPLSVDQMAAELDKAVKIAGLRAHNETSDSFWLELKKETWLGGKFHGMLRRHYSVRKPPATADCLNSLATTVQKKRAKKVEKFK